MRIVLTYHSIDPSGSVISIHESVFRRHVEWLAASEISVVDCAALLDMRSEESGVAITFDDAFTNFAERAWPILKDHGLPATLFVPTDYVGMTNRWNVGIKPPIPELPILDWHTLGRLAEEGASLGSHTCSHCDLRTEQRQRLQAELHESATAIAANAGVRPTALAYPFGYTNPTVIEATRTAYDVAVSTEMRAITDNDDRHRIPRLDAYYYRDAHRLERFGTPAFSYHLLLRSSLRRVREALPSVRAS